MLRFTRTVRCAFLARTFICAALLALASACRESPSAQSASAEESVPDTAYQLVWADEFDYEGLPDSSKWSYDLGDGCPNVCGWGNNEAQYYTEKRPENARVTGGRLVIEAHREEFGGKEFTSARLVTRQKGDWKYGRFLVKAKLPQGRGTWPAIWMLSTVESRQWPLDGEIDIMEHVGFDQGTVHGTIHTEAFNHTKGTQLAKTIFLADASERFYEYSLEWTPSYLRWFVDGEEFLTLPNTYTTLEEWPFDAYNFHLLLNLAIGGNWGGQQGIDPDVFPQRFEVEYVRVFQPIVPFAAR